MKIDVSFLTRKLALQRSPSRVRADGLDHSYNCLNIGPRVRQKAQFIPGSSIQLRVFIRVNAVSAQQLREPRNSEPKPHGSDSHNQRIYAIVSDPSRQEYHTSDEPHGTEEQQPAIDEPCFHDLQSRARTYKLAERDFHAHCVNDARKLTDYT